MTNIHSRPRPGDHEPKPKTHLTRRGRAAALLASGIAGYLLNPVVNEAIEGVQHVAHAVSSDIHQENEADHYSQRNLYDKMQKNGGFDLSKDLVYTVGQSDTPQIIATHIGAKDIRLVGDEISGQEGGAGNLHFGDEVVIPKDQLNPPK